MNTVVLTAPFDPVTQAEMEYAAAVLKRPDVDAVILAAEADGVIDQKKRLAFLKRAVRPYRKMYCASSEGLNGERLSDELIDSERIVREGAFRKAAFGIRALLAEGMDYLETAVDALCKPKRAAHSRSVAELCRTLAKIHGIDPDKAWKTGMLHDVTKAWPDDKGMALLEIYAPEIVPMAPAVYHSYTCPVFLKTVMGIEDQEILQAIREHTLGTCSGTLSKILYIADKIEPTRGYDVSKETELAKKDLDAAFKLVYMEAEQYRERRTDGGTA